MKNSQNEGARHIPLLWPLLCPYKPQIGAALVAIAVSAFTVLVFGWGLKHLVDEGFSDRSGHYLNQALLALLFVILLLALAGYARFYLVHWVAERAIAELRKKIYTHLLALDPSYYEQHPTGEQVSRINTDTTVLQMVITTNLPMSLRHVLTLLGGMVMLFIVSPSMMGMMIAVVPLVIAPIIFFARRVRSKSRETQGRIGDVSAFSHETLQGLQTIQSFGYEREARQKFSGLADEVFSSALKYVRQRAFLNAFVIAMVFSAIGVVLWMGGHQVLQGKISGGELSAFVFYAVVTAGAAGALSEAAGAFSQAAGAADRIAALLAARPQSNAGAVALPSVAVAGKIVFDRVSFTYPTRPMQPALENISFTIKEGEVVALMGPSGGGKSTVFQLLQRFYDPQAGKITIGGMDIALSDAGEVRKIMGLVSQDPAIFSMSVGDNIRLGKPEAGEDEVRRAAELAQAHEFIATLPEGYDTLVGERGSRLSGGQKQRIAIARAILKNPKILLLDEATSALDSSNEQAVMLALKCLMRGRTTVIIAHRLSTAQAADRIILLDHGRIAAEGSHEQLLGKNSLYTHLAELQMQAKAV